MKQGGKGSHRNFAHLRTQKPIIISRKLVMMQNIIRPGQFAWPGEAEEMKDSAEYAKIVEWSVEDQCYVVSAPGLILGGCHGDDEKQVFEELC